MIKVTALRGLGAEQIKQVKVIGVLSIDFS